MSLDCDVIKSNFKSTYKGYKQFDSKWANDIVSTTSGKVMRQIGCYITAFADAL